MVRVMNSCHIDRSMSADSSTGKPGPFEVKLHNLAAPPRRFSAIPLGNSAPDISLEDEPPGPMAEPPRRRYECAHYDTCLDLAAALNWNSFTCRGCSGSVDETLMWRARQKARKDSIAKALCDLPPIVAHRTAEEGIHETHDTDLTNRKGDVE